MNNDIKHLPNGDFVVSKLCLRCGDYLPLTAFYRDRAKADGYQRRCKCCQQSEYQARKVRKIASLLQGWKPLKVIK